MNKEQFEQIHEAMAEKLHLIAYYSENGMTDFLMMELDHLKHYMDLELNNISKILPLQ